MSDVRASAKYMKIIRRDYANHPECLAEGIRSVNIIRILENQMLITKTQGDIPLLARLQPATHPVKTLDTEWKEGSMIRGVLFFRDLSPTSCDWMSQLFHDAYEYLNKQRFTDKDYSDIPFNPLKVCNHFRKISEFLAMCSSSNLEVWSDY